MYWYDHEKRIRKEERELGRIQEAVFTKMEEGKSGAETLVYLQKRFSLIPEDAEKYYLEFRDEALQEMNPVSE